VQLRYLCETAWANTEATDGEGRTPLHSAVKSGHVELVKYLCEEAHANLRATDFQGNTPLDLATAYDEKLVQKCLEEAEMEAAMAQDIVRVSRHLDRVFTAGSDLLEHPNALFQHTD
jgi:ankyrin repeat protein